jgi:hypothetical protein
LRPAYGQASAAAHLAQLPDAVKYECRSLALDIDTPAELSRLLEPDAQLARATRRFLGHLR